MAYWQKGFIRRIYRRKEILEGTELNGILIFTVSMARLSQKELGSLYSLFSTGLQTLWNLGFKEPYFFPSLNQMALG